MAYTNTIKKGENLSTIAQRAGLSPAEFARLNPELAGSGPGTYQGLKNLVREGQGYNLAPTPAPTATPTAPVATPTAYKPATVPQGSLESEETLAARKAQADYLASLTQPDEDKTYQDTIAKFQAQIDATNSTYADELARAKVTGAGRLGTRTAISARRGLIGSDFGEAEAVAQEQGNEDVYKSIENERLAKVNAILTQAKSDATAEIRAKREEFAKGLDARLAFYSEADTRKATNASKAIKALISQGLSPKDIDPKDLNQIAKYYGVATDDIIAGYDTEKKAIDDANKQDAEYFNLSQGQTRYVYDPKTGQTKQIASIPKSTTTTTKKTTDTQASKEIVAKGEKVLNDARGDDGWTDPYLYKDAYDSWVNDGMGTAAQFLTKFPPKNYVNPDATFLPEYLQNKVKKSTTSTRSID